MARFELVDSFDENREQGQPVKSSPTWPIVVVVVFFVVSLLVVSGVFAWKLGWLSALDPSSVSSTPEVIDLSPAGSTAESIKKHYEWSYAGVPYELNLSIEGSLYYQYSRMERAPVEDYSIYVTHPEDDEFIETIADELKDKALEKGYDLEETVNFTASFVQNLKYKADVEEYPNYPVETLVDKDGDCEDTAILTAALLQSMGYDAVLIRFSPATEGEAGHMAVGVAVTGVSGTYYPYGGKNYYYLETTSASWELGEMPPDILADYGGKSDGIYELVPAPILQFSGRLESSVEGGWFSDPTVDLTVTVTNWGTAKAKDFYVRAFFEGHETGAKSSATYDLAYDHRISGVVVEGIPMPSGGGTLRVELYQGSDVVDEYAMDIS